MNQAHSDFARQLGETQPHQGGVSTTQSARHAVLKRAVAALAVMLACSIVTPAALAAEPRPSTPAPFSAGARSITSDTDTTAGHPAEPTTERVRRGDSLWSIARFHLTPHASRSELAAYVRALWRRNRNRIGTGNPNRIPVGTILKLPSPRPGNEDFLL